MSVRVEVVDGALTRELRRAVLRPALPPGAPMPGDDRPDAVHLAALTSDGAAVATCFIHLEPCPWLPDRGPSWHLRQMATAPQRRGAGIGRAVLAAALRYAIEAGGAMMWCNAREPARVFYAAAGFHTYGAVFVDDQLGIPHVRMWRELGREPDGTGTSS